MRTAGDLQGVRGHLHRPWVSEQSAGRMFSCFTSTRCSQVPNGGMPASKSFRPSNDEYYGDSSKFFDIRKCANYDYRSSDDYCDGCTGGALWG